MKTHRQKTPTYLPLALGAIQLLTSLACASAPNRSHEDDLVAPSELPPAPAGSPVALHGQLRVEGALLKDQTGLPIQLKGVSSMWLNWESRPFSRRRSALGFMRDNWKVSVIRAAMGTEVSGGYLNGNRAGMLESVETVIQNAIVLGVYVLVDWHTEKAVDQQADAVAFFSALAQKYGSFPNVIWEPYNEPRGYTWEQVKSYHEAVVDAIRAVDPDNLIVLGTPNWSQDVDAASLNPVNPAGGPANLLYALHFYACTHGQGYRDKGNTAMANGLALFVTEFGATPANGGTPPDNRVCRDEANAWFDWMGTNNISGAAWKLDQCSDSSCILAADAPAKGPWTDDFLTTDANNTPAPAGGTLGGGHGLFVVDWIRR